MTKHTLAFLLLLCLFVPTVVVAQDAPAIAVPAGFRVEKVLDTNKCTDPQNIAFMPGEAGDFLVASMVWRLCHVSAVGEVSVAARFATNREPNPFDILIAPDGTVYFSDYGQMQTPGLYKLDNGRPVRITPPGWRLEYFTRDEQGTFYAVTTSMPPTGGRGVVKIMDHDGDGQYEDVQPLIARNAQGLVYRGGFLYVVVAGTILKYDATGVQVGGPLVSGLNGPHDLAVDTQGNLYTIVADGAVTEGYASYNKYDVVLVPSGGGAATPVVEDVKGGLYISIDPNDVLYLSEFNRGVISKVVGGNKIDVTRDTGFNSPSEIAFDALNRPYLSSFRFSQLKRLDPNARTLEPVTPMLGESTQTIGVDDDGSFYLSEGLVNGFFRVDPLSGAVEQRTVPWSRTVRFDAFGRLVVIQNSVMWPTPDDISTTLGIVDFDTGVVTPYISGQDLVRFLFDKDQNLYARHRRWEGIVKVNVPETPTPPPFDASEASLFYDLRSKNSEIRYFDLNTQGQLLISLVDAREVVLGETDGRWGDFASGFEWPGYVRFDRNGVLYVVDLGPVYRIIGRTFVIPAVTQRIGALGTDVRATVGARGVVTSLCTKLDSAISSLSRGNVTAAMNQLTAFVHAIEAQKGKGIHDDTAERLLGVARSIIAGLTLL